MELILKTIRNWAELSQVLSDRFIKQGIIYNDVEFPISIQVKAIIDILEHEISN